MKEIDFFKISYLLFIVSILLPLTSCSPFHNKQAIVANTPSTDLSEENIDGIVLGMNIKESNFIQKHKIENNGSNSYNLDNNNYGILTNSEDEITFIAGNETVKTGKGIKHGYSIYEVINKYGENYYEYTVQGVRTIGYIDHKNKCKIDFWYVDNKVIDIILSYDQVDPIL